ncbi:MAG: hypothetical protein KUG83_07745 [Gammaproteobacteria bacterium]|nr:hypothetical protein [Gammaproteobacteria bacterium]
MKKALKATLRAGISSCIYLLGFLYCANLSVANDEEGGIGGTGYDDAKARLLRPDIPNHDIRPDMPGIPERPQTMERPLERIDAFDADAIEAMPEGMPEKIGK